MIRTVFTVANASPAARDVPAGRDAGVVGEDELQALESESGEPVMIPLLFGWVAIPLLELLHRCFVISAGHEEGVTCLSALSAQNWLLMV